MKTEQSIKALLKSKHTPADFAEISAYLDLKGALPNKTTIYRNLEKLEKESFIKKVILSDHKQYWELAQTDPQQQHYHLICQKCEVIECKELSFEVAFEFLNFKILKTNLNFYGFCQNCI